MSRGVPCEASAGAGARDGGAGGAVRDGSHGAGGREKGGHSKRAGVSMNAACSLLLHPGLCVWQQGLAGS